MQRLLLLLTCIPFLTIAQDYKNSEGIQWLQDHTWKQVIEKAKKEKKYIFIDCFATWCQPCKAMDKEVFSNREVVEAQYCL